jgi:DNA topoisomerase-1
MKVVVVESPAKARTINKYLGKDFTVLASYGHVRDLPAKNGSVRPDDDFSMDWEIDPRAQKHIKEIARALRGADHLYLATDPDREGEAISWHVQEVLQEANLLTGIDVKRVVFNEITRGAVLEAMGNPRELDRELIDAYLARRALDYLVGFTLSPVLWRKLPGSRSAGRVQSVALRLICDRESEIEAFRADEYWTVKAAFRTAADQPLIAQLTHLNGVKLDKLALGDEAAAAGAMRTIRDAAFAVAKVERKQARRHPAPPFTTSTLQQEASRKLNFGAKRTMQVAQRLYEGVDIGGETVGLITYMRTDAVNMAGEAVLACRDLIGREYGAVYVPGSSRVYKTKAKNAQEAHEAIRPTDVARRPRDMAQRLDNEQLRLYELIWKRTVACQMESAVLDQVAVDVGAGDGSAVLRATGSVVVFDGFLRLYRESQDDAPDEDDDRILPDVKEGGAMATGEVTPEQHFTQPPPRFSEASLVKRLEELGIGRPSTYASIISVLQDREYVRLEKRRFEPEDRGRLVTAFLVSFFERYVEYTFTADMENQLDDISGGRTGWKAVLKQFWGAFDEAVGETKNLTITDVLEALNTLLGPHFFPDDGTHGDPRSCPSCEKGRLSLKLGKFGAFIGCADYPSCRYTRPLVADGAGEENGPIDAGPKFLGEDPESGLPVWLRKGPYGLYVQLGDVDQAKEKVKGKTKGKAKEKPKEKPKRTSLPKGTDVAKVDLARALALLSLPREVGVHPESGGEITAGIGRYGPYIRHDGKYVSLKDDDVLSIGLNRAVTLIAEAPAGAKATTLGNHPGDGKPVTVRAGRFGPYAQHGVLRATLPKSMEPETMTLEAAVALLAVKAAKGGKGVKKKPTAAKRKKPAKSSGGAAVGNDQSPIE